MRIIVVASRKGGVGKSTIANNLAVAATEAGHAAVLADFDPQGSTTDWWNRRGRDSPGLVSASGDPVALIAKLRAAGDGLAFLDTPPSDHPWLGGIIAASDAVLVPVRPSPHDLAAVSATMALVHGRTWSFVLSQVKPRSRLTAEAMRVLLQAGPVAPVQIGDRVEYPVSAAAGQAVVETQPKGAAADEIRTLLTYVLAQLRK